MSAHDAQSSTNVGKSSSLEAHASLLSSSTQPSEGQTSPQDKIPTPATPDNSPAPASSDDDKSLHLVFPEGMGEARPASPHSAPATPRLSSREQSPRSDMPSVRTPRSHSSRIQSPHKGIASYNPGQGLSHSPSAPSSPVHRKVTRSESLESDETASVSASTSTASHRSRGKRSSLQRDNEKKKKGWKSPSFKRALSASGVILSPHFGQRRGTSFSFGDISPFKKRKRVKVARNRSDDKDSLSDDSGDVSDVSASELSQLAHDHSYSDDPVKGSDSPRARSFSEGGGNAPLEIINSQNNTHRTNSKLSLFRKMGNKSSRKRHKRSTSSGTKTSTGSRKSKKKDRRSKKERRKAAATRLRYGASVSDDSSETSIGSTAVEDPYLMFIVDGCLVPSYLPPAEFDTLGDYISHSVKIFVENRTTYQPMSARSPKASPSSSPRSRHGSASNTPRSRSNTPRSPSSSTEKSSKRISSKDGSSIVLAALAELSGSPRIDEEAESSTPSSRNTTKTQFAASITTIAPNGEKTLVEPRDANEEGESVDSHASLSQPPVSDSDSIESRRHLEVITVDSALNSSESATPRFSETPREDYLDPLPQSATASSTSKTSSYDDGLLPPTVRSLAQMDAASRASSEASSSSPARDERLTLLKRAEIQLSASDAADEDHSARASDSSQLTSSPKESSDTSQDTIPSLSVTQVSTDSLLSSDSLEEESPPLGASGVYSTNHSDQSSESKEEGTPRQQTSGEDDKDDTIFLSWPYDTSDERGFVLFDSNHCRARLSQPVPEITRPLRYFVLTSLLPVEHTLLQFEGSSQVAHIRIRKRESSDPSSMRALGERLNVLNDARKRAQFLRRFSKKNVSSTSTIIHPDKDVSTQTGLFLHIKQAYKTKTLSFTSERAGKEIHVEKGTVDDLINLLVHKDGVIKAYQLSFLMTYEKMLSGPELLSRLKALFEYHSKRDTAANVCVKIFDFCKLWVAKRSWTFENDKELGSCLLEWAETLSSGSPIKGINPLVVKGFYLFVKSCLGVSINEYRLKTESALTMEDEASADPPVAWVHMALPVVDIFDFHPKEVARQMTLCAAALNKDVDAQEWLRKDQNNADSALTKAVSRFNRTSEWIATLVVHGSTPEFRALLIRYFIHVGVECLALNNYSGVLEVVSGLTNSAVSRLLQTFDKLPASVMKRFENLKSVVSMDNNYRRLRELLQKSELPGVPFLGLYTSDLFAIESGNLDLDPENEELINFQKMEMIAQIILDFERFKMSRYHIIPVPMIMDYLTNHLHVMDEDSLYNLSLSRESRESNSDIRSRLEKKGKGGS